MICLSAKVTESIAKEQETSEYSFVVELGISFSIHVHAYLLFRICQNLCVCFTTSALYFVKVGVIVQHGYQTKPEVSEL